MRRIGKIADRLLNRLAPATKAAAGECGLVSCPGGGFKYCCTTTNGGFCGECQA